MSKRALETWKINKIEYGEKPLALDAIALNCVREAMKKALDQVPTSSAETSGAIHKVEQDRIPKH